MAGLRCQTTVRVTECRALAASLQDRLFRAKRPGHVYSIHFARSDSLNCHSMLLQSNFVSMFVLVNELKVVKSYEYGAYVYGH